MSRQDGSGPVRARACLSALKQDIATTDLTEDKRTAFLEELKVLGRELANVQTLYDLSGFKVLGHYAFDGYSKTTSREALRCMANALLLIPSTQSYFAELQYLSPAMKGLKSKDNDDEFLLSRILFLMTYNKATEFERVADEQDLATSIMNNIHRHAQAPEELSSNATAAAALSDTLKLLFNITHAYPRYSSVFTKAVPDLLELIATSIIPSPPLQPPLSWKLNALASVDLQLPGEEAMTLSMEPAVDQVVLILETSLKAYKATQLDVQAIPLITILRKLNGAANDDLRAKLKSELLPKDSERNLPLGQSSTLASRLLRLTTQPGLVNLPEAVASLLFELSEKDASAFVRNVGYGYAAGYLMTHKIPIPEDVQRPSSSRGVVPINPVTGQRLDKEPKIDLPEWSEEEKEREAERLFVLFERLKATGVVDVQNPAHQARDEGRFKEIPD